MKRQMPVRIRFQLLRAGSSVKANPLQDTQVFRRLVSLWARYTLHWRLNLSFRKMKMPSLAKGRAGNMDSMDPLGSLILFRLQSNSV